MEQCSAAPRQASPQQQAHRLRRKRAGIPPGGCVLSEAVRKGDAAGLGMFLSDEGYLQEAGLQVCDRQGC